MSGTDAQNQLGGLDLGASTRPVTVQLLADLDTGLWSTQFDAGGGFVNLVTNGTGLTTVDQIQFIADGGANGWAFGGVGGESQDFVLIDSVSLTHIESVPEPGSTTLLVLISIGMMARRRK